jgi:PEP-CTERM motif-containing protein
MSLKMLKAIVAALVLSVSCLVNTASATLITTGTLEYNTLDDVITNTDTGLTYLGWGLAAEFTYQETLDATANGGLYEEYHIANAIEANEFFNAATFNKIYSPGNYIINNPLNILAGERFGGSDDGIGGYAWFLSDTEDMVNALHFKNSGDVTGFEFLNDYKTVTASDYYIGGFRGTAISWLLVADEKVPSVPEPSTLAIFALGMIGLASRRFKKQS